MDEDAAYCCLHTNLKSASTFITIINKIAHLLLRLPFNSSPAAGEFSVLTDLIVDLIMELLHDDSWDPGIPLSHYHSLFESLPAPLISSSPFGATADFFVTMKEFDLLIDGYIDDLISLGLDSPRNRQRLRHAISIILTTIFRSLDPNDPLPRQDIISEAKAFAEGALEEAKVILGWLIDFHQFKICLPSDKAQNWLFDISNAIKDKKVSRQILESIIGCLNHASFVIPFGRYFLSRLRFCLKCARQRNYKIVNLTTMDIDDLILWSELLEFSTSKGININHITFTHPSIVTISDACEHGIGGFILGGPGWRYLLPPHLVGRFSLNLLEFIASVLTFEFAIHHTTQSNIPRKILAFTDSSSGLGWLFKSTFDPIKQPCHDKVT